MGDEKIIEAINFEKPRGDSTTYLTHNFHSYPAKFIPQIPRITIQALTKEKEVILDPFCGCGTTLVEAKLLNRKCIGVDLNPIATLVSETKTTKLNENDINIILKLLPKIKEDIENLYNNKKTDIQYIIPDFNNRDHWFQNNVLNELAIIKTYIEDLENKKIKNFLYTAFSSIIVSVSNQESDTRFAAIEKNIHQYRTFNEFNRKVDNMIKRIIEFSEKSSDSLCRVYLGNTQKMNFIKDDEVDHIVTSPPYANTYDYYLYHKFRIYWLGHQLKEFQDNEIGSRNRHSSKKEDISTFKNSLNECLKEMSRVLKKGKYAVIVIGDSVIRGKLIKADDLINEIAKTNNFKDIRTISYKLSQNSRMFNPKFTNQDKLEHIMFLKNEK